MKINEKELLIALNKSAYWLTKGNWALSDDLVGGAMLYRATNPNKFKNQNFINTIKLLRNKMKWLNVDYHRKNWVPIYDAKTKKKTKKKFKIEPLVNLKEEEIDVPDKQSNMEEKIDKKLKAIKAKEIISKMDEICREILELFIDNTTDEISSILKIKPGTVLSRIHNCRKKLFRILA